MFSINSLLISLGKTNPPTTDVELMTGLSILYESTDLALPKGLHGSFSCPEYADSLSPILVPREEQTVVVSVGKTLRTSLIPEVTQHRSVVCGYHNYLIC